MTFGSLFTGIGGFDLGLERAGMECRWQVEKDEYCQRVLTKHWPAVKRYGDIRQINGADLEPVNLICGGFPCQDISSAGTRRGIVASRSGLWKDFARMVGAVRPQFILVENSPALRGRGLALVLQDINALGFDAEWHCIPACAFGAHHERDRIYILAYPPGREARLLSERPRPNRQGEINALWPYQTTSDAGSERRDRPEGAIQTGRYAATGGIASDVDGEPLVGAAISRGECHAWTFEPGVVRMVHGIPHRVDRIRGLGNAVIPQVAEWIGRRILEVAAP